MKFSSLMESWRRNIILMPIQELSHTKILKQNMIRQVLYIISTRIFLAEIIYKGVEYINKTFSQKYSQNILATALKSLEVIQSPVFL